MSVVAAGVGSWLAEEAGERGDDLEHVGVGTGLLVGEVPGLVVGGNMTKEHGRAPHPGAQVIRPSTTFANMMTPRDLNKCGATN